MSRRLAEKPRNGAAQADHAFLAELGERVRQMRARRGMTRKLLARDSGVSERYLAQLESGAGNISVLLLRRVAAAMGLPLAVLIDEAAERPVETGGAARGRRIALIGLRGAGKTTLGRRLAARLGVPFVEMAAAIAEESGTSLSEIFSLYGQAAYRRYERRALERVLAAHERAVIATGGSLVSEAGTFELLLRSCHTIWVQASPGEHMSRVMAQGDLRPMQASREAMADLKRILETRQALYAKAAAAVDTSGRTVEASFQALVAAAERLLAP